MTMATTSKDKASAEQRVNEGNETVLVYHDICLKFDDVSLLTGPYWLNDQIIAFYFQYLESSKYADESGRFLFVAPSVCQLLKMSPSKEADENCQALLHPLEPKSKSLILFAVNDNDGSAAGGTHWSLLVYSQEENMFFSFDSMKNHNRDATRKLIKVLKNCLGCSLADDQDIECTQQRNAYDCGIHLLANCENVCDYFLREGVVMNVPRLSTPQVRSKRGEVLDLVISLRTNA